MRSFVVPVSRFVPPSGIPGSYTASRRTDGPVTFVTVSGQVGVRLELHVVDVLAVGGVGAGPRVQDAERHQRRSRDQALLGPAAAAGRQRGEREEQERTVMPGLRVQGHSSTSSLTPPARPPRAPAFRRVPPSSPKPARRHSVRPGSGRGRFPVDRTRPDRRLHAPHPPRRLRRPPGRERRARGRPPATAARTTSRCGCPRAGGGSTTPRCGAPPSSTASALGTSAPSYEAAFEHEDADEPFEYPYVLVQFVPRQHVRARTAISRTS